MLFNVFDPSMITKSLGGLVNCFNTISEDSQFLWYSTYKDISKARRESSSNTFDFLRFEKTTLLSLEVKKCAHPLQMTFDCSLKCRTKFEFCLVVFQNMLTCTFIHLYII